MTIEGAVKYDRPVWQLMYECADAMPDPFRYEDVQAWFARFYPDVGQATIRAHLVGLCEGGRPKQAQFAHRASLFRRVARGRYQVIPAAARTVDPDLPARHGLSPEAMAQLKDGGVARFAESAFEDATVVRAEPASDDAADEHPDLAPVLRPRPRGDDTAGLLDELGARVLGTVEGAPSAADAPSVVVDSRMESADVVLVGSDDERVLVPAPAREVFRATRFQSARVHAERLGLPWFVLTVEHGALEPTEWMSPEARALTDFDPAYRLAWAHWVVARLESLDRPVRGRAVHIDAPAAYSAPLVAVLHDAGAIVTVTDAPPPEHVLDAVEQERAAGAVVGEREVRDAVRFLAHRPHAVSPSRLDLVQEVSGVFAWHVDAEGAAELDRSVQLPIGEGVLHVGHAGALGRSPDTVATLRQLIQDVQLGGRSRTSTFRSSLAAILREPLQMRTWDDPVLTRWMERHLTVVTWPVADRSSILALAHRVVAALEPPLNVDHLRSAAMRQRLGQLRSSFG